MSSFLSCPHYETCPFYKEGAKILLSDEKLVPILHAGNYSCRVLNACQDDPSQGGATITKDLESKMPKTFECSHITQLNLLHKIRFLDRSK